MNEMTQFTGGQVAAVEPVAAPLNPMVADLHAWAESANAAHRVAQTLVQSSFVPASFKGNAIEATAAILAGAEIGLQPMAALKSFDVIQGVAAPRALTLRAVVQSKGHEVELVESTTTRCRMKGRRRGSQSWQSVDWTIDRAKQLGVTGKDNWKKQPQAMLLARATSEICRLIAADAILGIGYSIEELADGAGEEIQVIVEPQPAPKRRSVGRRKPQPEPEPVEEVAEPVTEADAGPEGITPAQLTALNAGLTGIVGSDRSEKLAWLTHSLGREITSSKDLTKEEASHLIDWFNQPAPTNGDTGE